MFKTFRVIVARDLILALRRRTDLLTTLFFFIIVISLFPLGVGTEKEILRQIAPGIAWVAALLASMLALERLFANDFLDGTLEQMILAPQPLSVLVLAKVFAHWLLTGLPLVLIAPLVGLQYHLSADSLGVLMLALLMGIALTGLGMDYITHTDIVALKAFFLGLMYFNWQPIPEDPLLLVHLGLVATLMIIFPVSKLLHAPGVFFSPTRNQVDNPRAEPGLRAHDSRHIAPWAAELDNK